MAETWQDEAWKHRDKLPHEALEVLARKMDVPEDVIDIAEPGSGHYAWSEQEADELERKSGLSPGAIVAENSGDWCAPSEASVFGWNTPAMELPTITVRRGGIRYQRFPVYITVKKIAWREFYVQVRTHGQSQHELIGPFAKRKHAVNAKEVIDRMTSTIDRLWYEETKDR